MIKILSLFDPRRIAGQIAILVVLAVVLVQAIFFGILVMVQPPDIEPPGRPLQDRFAAVLRVLDSASDPTARTTVLATLSRALPSFRLEAAAADESPMIGDSSHVLDRIRLQSGVKALGLSPAQSPEAAGDVRRLVATLSDGSRVAGVLDLRDQRPPRAKMMLIGSLTFIAVALGLLLLWTARSLTSPLTRFAAAAGDFSLDTASPPLREDGPREIRVAARALNRMQSRIRRLVDDRTRMLAAISHDLRTPITRLRLRAEFVAEEATRSAMLRDLDQMDAMTSGALSFLSPGNAGAAASRVDLSTLLATVADDFGELGRNVTFAGPDRIVVAGRTDELVRAVTNLVENALRYAGQARITLRVFPGVAEIDVADDGPGIPLPEREALMQPFARGDAARTLDGSTGFGLGLSIARSVAERHGGRLSLLDAEPSGLLARITLPREPEAAPRPQMTSRPPLAAE